MLAGAAQLALEILLKATVPLVVGTLAVWLLRGPRYAARRHLALFTTLCACLAIAVSAVVLPSWEVAIPSTGSLEAAVSRAGPTSGPASVGEFVWQLLPGEGATVPPDRMRMIGWPTTLALVLWGAGTLVLLLRMALGALAAWRLARSARPVLSDRLQRALGAAGRALDLRRDVRLVWGPPGSAPATFGTLAPHVLLPPDAHEWSAQRLHLVLLHELAHVARRDCATQMVADAALALLWVHPGVWWAARRLREEREQACDQAVVGASGVSPDRYAGELLRIVLEHAPLRRPVAVSMAAGTGFERRIRAILNGGPPIKFSRSGRVLRAATVGVLCAGAVALGCLSRGVLEAPKAGASLAMTDEPPIVDAFQGSAAEFAPLQNPVRWNGSVRSQDSRLVTPGPQSQNPALTCWAHPGRTGPPRLVIQLGDAVRERTWLRFTPDSLAAEVRGSASVASTDGGLRCWKSNEVGIGLTGEWGPADVADLLFVPGARVVLESPGGEESEVSIPSTMGTVLCEVVRTGSVHTLTCSAQSLRS